MIINIAILHNDRDDTIVSGDSLGRVQIWNGEMGTVDFVLDHHSADVLCLAAAAERVSIIN